MRSLRSRVVGQFGRPSGPLGRLVGVVMSARGSNRQRNAWTVEQLGLRPDDRVLEIGYGPGLAVHQASRVAREVVGVDHSAVMHEQASRRNRDGIAAGRISLRHGTIADLYPSHATHFTKVLAVNVLMFWADPAATGREIGRLLAPGATIAVTYQARNAAATDEDTQVGASAAAAALRAAGYTNVRIRILPLKPVSAACVLADWPGEDGAARP